MLKFFQAISARYRIWKDDRAYWADVKKGILDIRRETLKQRIARMRADIELGWLDLEKDEKFIVKMKELSERENASS